MMRRGVLAAGAAMMMLGLVGCGGSDEPVDYRILRPGIDSLRTAFDAAEGKVRALFLASPT